MNSQDVSDLQPSAGLRHSRSATLSHHTTLGSFARPSHLPPRRPVTAIFPDEWRFPAALNHRDQSTDSVADLEKSFDRVNFQPDHSVEDGDHSHVQRSLNPRHHTRNFSTLHSVSDSVRSVVRRASVTLRPKHLHWAHHESSQHEHPPDSFLSPRNEHAPSKAAGWLRRAASFRHHRAPHFSTSPPDAPPVWHVSSPVPGNGSAPPILPDDPNRGAAARAAAAAENERLGVGRAVAKIETRIDEPMLERDAESGIGMEVRYPIGPHADYGLSMVRKDPAVHLPMELWSMILSRLDPRSLMESELVSRGWNAAAVSHHVWRNIFLKEYGRNLKPRASELEPYRVGGAGLGRIVPDQDWKRMYQVRKTLDARWRNGSAAAIYLNGHTDSVYCAQFDEWVQSPYLSDRSNRHRNKLITGSRDQTIRVWDMHTYQCTKIIGSPQAVDFSSSSSHQQHHNHHALHTTSTSTAPIATQTHAASSSAAIRSTPSDYHSASILCLQYDATTLITGSSDTTCIIWSLPSFTPLARLRIHKAPVLDLTFDDKHIVTCSKDCSLAIWSRIDGSLLHHLPSAHKGPVNAVQMRGNLVVSASGDGVAKLWNLDSLTTSGSLGPSCPSSSAASNACVKEFHSAGRGLACVEFSSDARFILAGGNDHIVYVFDTASGHLVSSLVGHKGLVRSLHLDEANARVVSGSYDLSVRVWDWKHGVEPRGGEPQRIGAKGPVAPPRPATMATAAVVVEETDAVDREIGNFPGWTTSWILSAKGDYRRVIGTSQDGSVVLMDFGYGLAGVELLEG
ncbi:MAG: hypothetical protein M1819_006188 [Sarea resinae]|nr:MAG: hypothetical protein M1819_006188 [Sarea resinae]